ncbi:uncharacterized protein LOC142328455 [Lycorma delicatula]|uniref:uncharacterized protein LOC142328455 n=1 Tax=Lycorma delicatula TaxID=130591 RepID=UPI003F50D4FB
MHRFSKTTVFSYIFLFHFIITIHKVSSEDETNSEVINPKFKETDINWYIIDTNSETKKGARKLCPKDRRAITSISRLWENKIVAVSKIRKICKEIDNQENDSEPSEP